MDGFGHSWPIVEVALHAMVYARWLVGWMMQDALKGGLAWSRVVSMYGMFVILHGVVSIYTRGHRGGNYNSE